MGVDMKESLGSLSPGSLAFHALMLAQFCAVLFVQTARREDTGGTTPRLAARPSPANATLSVKTRIRMLALGAVMMLVPFSASAAAAELTDALFAYVRQDHSRAVEELTGLAERDGAVAQAMLGAIHSSGDGAPRDNVMALKWFGLAAAQGYAEAQFRLGEMYRDGLGAPADGRLARIWFRRAARQGVPHAFNALGELYAGAAGIAADEVAALDWFRDGAAFDNAEAMYNLGMRYALGKGTPADAIEAHKWFRLAAGAPGEEREKALRARAVLAERLTPAEVAMADARTDEWLRSSRPRAPAGR
jgi:hypothetical protein